MRLHGWLPRRKRRDYRPRRKKQYDWRRRKQKKPLANEHGAPALLTCTTSLPVLSPTSPTILPPQPIACATSPIARRTCIARGTLPCGLCAAGKSVGAARAPEFEELPIVDVTLRGVEGWEEEDAEPDVTRPGATGILVIFSSMIFSL